jgi:hypothetical protein
MMGDDDGDSREEVLRDLLGEESEDVRLDTGDLQANAAADGGRMRIPSAVLSIPEQGTVVVGFDSGEVQCYGGFPGKLEAGKGFKISERVPVLMIKYLHGWNPFVDDVRVGMEDEENFGVSWKVVLKRVFELCRRTQQPSLTSRLVGGSTFGLWPLFHVRDGGKWTEMTATQHGGTLIH